MASSRTRSIRSSLTPPTTPRSSEDFGIHFLLRPLPRSGEGDGFSPRVLKLLRREFGRDHIVFSERMTPFGEIAQNGKVIEKSLSAYPGFSPPPPFVKPPL